MWTEPTTKVSSSKDLNVVTESIFLPMNRHTKDTSLEASLMAKVSEILATERATTVILRIMLWKAMVLICGPMGANLKESFRMVRSMDPAFLLSQMEEDSKDFGTKET